MNAAFPVKREKEFPLRAIHIDEDFLDERTHNALLQSRTCSWIGPDGFHLLSKPVEVSMVGVGS
jgi:hypothetical protein